MRINKSFSIQYFLLPLILLCQACSSVDNPMHEKKDVQQKIRDLTLNGNVQHIILQNANTAIYITFGVIDSNDLVKLGEEQKILFPLIPFTADLQKFTCGNHNWHTIVSMDSGGYKLNSGIFSSELQAHQVLKGLSASEPIELNIVLLFSRQSCPESMQTILNALSSATSKRVNVFIPCERERHK